MVNYVGFMSVRLRKRKYERDIIVYLNLPTGLNIQIDFNLFMTIIKKKNFGCKKLKNYSVICHE